MIHFKFVIPITLIGILLFSGYPECSEKKSIELERKIRDLEMEISDLKFKVQLLELAQKSYRTADLDPSSLKKYQRIDTSSGFFLVALEDVMPYLDGYKLILSIGNPSSATYNGFTLKVKWGKRFENSEEYAKWEKLTAKHEELSNKHSELVLKILKLEMKKTPSTKKLREEFEKVNNELKVLYADKELMFDFVYNKWKKSLSEKKVSFAENLKPASWNKIELIISPAKAEQIGYLELSMDTDGVILLEKK